MSFCLSKQSVPSVCCIASGIADSLGQAWLCWIPVPQMQFTEYQLCAGTALYVIRVGSNSLRQEMSGLRIRKIKQTTWWSKARANCGHLHQQPRRHDVTQEDEGGDCSETKQPGGSMLKSGLSFCRDYADFQGKRGSGWAEKTAKGQTVTLQKPQGRAQGSMLCHTSKNPKEANVACSWEPRGWCCDA